MPVHLWGRVVGWRASMHPHLVAAMALVLAGFGAGKACRVRVGVEGLRGESARGTSQRVTPTHHVPVPLCPRSTRPWPPFPCSLGPPAC